MKNQFPKILMLLIFGIVFNLQGMTESHTMIQITNELSGKAYSTEELTIEALSPPSIVQDTVKRKKELLKTNSTATSTGENLKPKK